MHSESVKTPDSLSISKDAKLISKLLLLKKPPYTLSRTSQESMQTILLNKDQVINEEVFSYQVTDEIRYIPSPNKNKKATINKKKLSHKPSGQETKRAINREKSTVNVGVQYVLEDTLEMANQEPARDEEILLSNNKTRHFHNGNQVKKFVIPAGAQGYHCPCSRYLDKPLQETMREHEESTVIEEVLSLEETLEMIINSKICQV